MRSLVILLVASDLAGCNGASGGPEAVTAPPAPGMAEAASGRVAALLPLSGPEASLGRSMLSAIQLALSGSTLTLDVDDTGGTPAGAARAAGQAVAAHDALILGPLTSGETRAAAPVAAASGVPVLAFTSDVTAARPGVWVLGLTPEQQVDRLVAAAHAEGRKSFAALLPENALGDVMAASYTKALAAEGAAPTIARHDASFASINDGLKALSAYASRAGDRDAEIRTDRASTDPAVRAEADQLAAEPVPPPPYDTLLLADTATQLQEVIDLLEPYDAKAGVRILGPALWGAFVRKLGPLAGAWYAAPDPAARAGFVQEFAAKNGTAPRGLDDTAFDAAALAAALARTGGITPDALTRADGFAGVDGVFLLLPDGHVRRALAVFQIDSGGGSHIVSPAPTRLAPGGGVSGA